MMCYVVVFKGGLLVYNGMQIDDGTSALKYAKEKGYAVRIWPMYGLTHLWELPFEIRDEIKNFLKGLH